MSGAPLPPGWTSAIDPSSGQTYYANPHTGASSWEPPPLAVVPPPPSPMRHPPVAQHYHHQQQQQQQQPPYHHAQQQHTQHYPPQPTHNHTTTASNNTNNHAVHQQLLQSQAQGFTAAQTPTITSTTPTNPLHAELTTLTVGQMADLCALRQEAQAAAQGDDHIKEGLEAYTPLNPIAVVPGGTMLGRPMMEAGRLDIRIHSLHDKLTKLKTGAAR